MITKNRNTETEKSEMLVILKSFDCLEDVERLKKSLLFCIKTIVLSKELYGEMPEIADVCALLEDLSLTEEQCLHTEELLFP